jgi:DNA-binding CsgD family transcriptional regulator
MTNEKLTAAIGGKLRKECGLTPSETAIVEALIAGRRPAEIAEARGGSVSTVRVHIRTIFYKLDIHSVNELFSLVLSSMNAVENDVPEALVG